MSVNIDGRDVPFSPGETWQAIAERVLPGRQALGVLVGGETKGLTETPVDGESAKTITINSTEGRLIYESARGRCELPFAAGQTIRTEYPGWPGEPATVSAGRAGEGLLRIRCYAIGDCPCGFDMLICFKEDTVTLQSRRSYDPLTHGYEGTASGERG